ncbi:hypothetical protein ACOBR2_03050 [Telmatobacter bradus]|uniref:hypothetical protein n=1 Tax=Telmatobacter bradus TaxID=474953 RepID=UPI003B42EDEC
MSSRTRYFLRIPLMLLALGDLVLLGLKLWPWRDIPLLPGQGTTGYDPVICLLAYLYLLYWIGGRHNPEVQKSLKSGLALAIPAGLLCIGFVFLDVPQFAHKLYAQIGILAAASIFAGIAGYKGQRFSKSPNVGIATGTWSAMISALMAVAVILARIDLSHPRPLTNDPWRQYQALAIGNPALQALVHGLNMASCFLLIAPLAGGMIALLFALKAQD